MKIFWCFIVGCVIGLIVTAVVKGDDSDKSLRPIKEVVYVPIPDSMTIQEVVYLKEELRRCQDSLRIIRTDSTMSSELFVAKYKLERIRYYNDIAAKGNNIKYLRGWINRVLNE